MAAVKPAEPALLELAGLRAGWRRTEVVHDVSLCLHPGEIVGLVGHNGAGKSTVVKSIFGLCTVFAGTVTVDGTAVEGWSLTRRMRAGMGCVPDGRAVFGNLSVTENLRIASEASRIPAAEARRLRSTVEELFPILLARSRQTVRLMSGGEQQMVSISMAVMSRPKLLVLDEPLLGLAPAVCRHVQTALAALRQRLGLTILWVEPSPRHLAAADRIVVLRQGEISGEIAAERVFAGDGLRDLMMLY
jgi:branched-chain amino acid transport system ATP-binding protein